MGDLFLLSQAQMRRIAGYFPLSHGIARVDDRRIVSAIVFVIKNGLRWRDAPPDYGPHKTIYNRVVGWSRWGAVAAWPPPPMPRTRQSTIGSCAGAAWACSTRFSPNWPARAASRSGS